MSLPAASKQQIFVEDVRYQGRKAKRVNIETNKINIAAHSSYDYPIDSAESGVLIAFTVAVNDPSIAVECIMYGDDNSEDIINNRTMREVAMLGRGLTLGEAEALDPDSTSLDKGGRPHAARPYLARYKNTFTGTETNYDLLKGTENDKWIVLEYAPTLPQQYSRIYFNIRNDRETGDRLIHHLFVSRIRFIDAEADFQLQEASDDSTEGETQGIVDFEGPPISTTPGTRTRYE